MQQKEENLTLLIPEKNGCHFSVIFSQNCNFWLKFHCILFLRVQLAESALVWVMAGHGTGNKCNKSLPKPMMTVHSHMQCFSQNSRQFCFLQIDLLGPSTIKSSKKGECQMLITHIHLLIVLKEFSLCMGHILEKNWPSYDMTIHDIRCLRADFTAKHGKSPLSLTTRWWMEPDLGSWQSPDISRSHLYRGTIAWTPPTAIYRAYTVLYSSHYRTYH